jgi:tetratricopeptide (TPR) repeat protein
LLNTAFDQSDALLAALRKDLERKRVLIIDRHPPARESMRMMMSTLNITRCHMAGAAAEVTRQVKSHDFDIILSDFLLEDDRDGQLLFEELRYAKLISLRTVYFIITSERAYRNVISLAELGPDDYIIKPFTAEQMQIRLSRAIYKKHVFKRVYDFIERNAFQEAVNVCDQIMLKHREFVLDALRFKGELLIALDRAPEAEEIYRYVLAAKSVPWAKMGLAVVMQEKGDLDGAAEMAHQVTQEVPVYMAAHDFLAKVEESRGNLVEAQAVLERAIRRSPNNSLRMRRIGDIATRNQDFGVAAQAYQRVLNRHRGSAINTVDDYTNLSRVLVASEKFEAAKAVISSLQQERKGEAAAELAALTSESLLLQQQQKHAEANGTLGKAVEMWQGQAAQTVSARVATDLGKACLTAGRHTEAQQILRQVVAENHEDKQQVAEVEKVFEQAGQGDTGRTMIEEVGNEIVQLNNRGVLAARQGDLEGSVQMLIEAANRMPNLQFLCNAIKAIATYADKRGWDEALAENAVRFVQQGFVKEPKNPKLASARDLLDRVAKKYGVILDLSPPQRQLGQWQQH